MYNVIVQTILISMLVFLSSQSHAIDVSADQVVKGTVAINKDILFESTKLTSQRFMVLSGTTSPGEHAITNTYCMFTRKTAKTGATLLKAPISFQITDGKKVPLTDAGFSDTYQTGGEAAVWSLTNASQKNVDGLTCYSVELGDKTARVPTTSDFDASRKQAEQAEFVWNSKGFTFSPEYDDANAKPGAPAKKVERGAASTKKKSK